jgi:CBS domain containing-hemolysin-like protein
MKYLPIFNCALLLLCLALSFLLSGMEAGVFALNRLRIRRLARSGNPSARVLHDLLEKPERFLWTILVGNTLVNFLILGWALYRLHDWFAGQRGLIVALFGVIVFFFYTFFDLLPKMLFRAHPNSMCLSVARGFRLIHLALRPFVSLVEEGSRLMLHLTKGRALTVRLFGNREEMRAVMQEAAQTFTRDEHAMINRVLDLQNLTVSQIAIPLAKVTGIEDRLPVSSVLTLARDKNLSRFPVWETLPDRRRRIAGLLSVGPLIYRADLDPGRPASAYMEPALFLDENLRLEHALRRLQRGGQRLAIILARDGREMGIVTLEDILKVMFGEIKL